MQPFSKNTPYEPPWNLYSGAILSLIIFFQILQWPLSPRFLDIYYHLSVMKGFADAGGYVTHAFWEYAPGGRPHLYPPFLHIIMLLFYKLGMKAMDVGRLVDVASYPALLTVYWFVSRKLYSDKIAFIALVLLSSVYSIMLASVTLSAFNLAIILLLLIVLKVHEKRFFQAGLLLGISFYVHTYAAGLSVLYLFLYLLGKKEDRPGCVSTLSLGLALGAPFLVYQAMYRDYFILVSKHLKESSLLEIDLAIYLLAFASVFSFREGQFFQKAFIPLCLWFCFMPMIATHPVRFYFGHGLLGLVWLAAISIERWSHKMGAFLLYTLLIFIVFISPVFHWNFNNTTGDLRWADRSMTRYLIPDPYLSKRTNGFTIYFQKPYEEMREIIQAHSQKGDSLWTDFSYTAGILAVVSDRTTSCAMLAEVKPFKDSLRIQDAKTIVWFKDANLEPRDGMSEAVKKYGLILLKEVEMAYIFDNPKYAAQTQIPKPRIPTLVLFLMTSLILGAALTPKIRS